MVQPVTSPTIKLKHLNTERGASCVYSTVDRQINVYDPYNNGKLQGSVSIDDAQIAALINAGLDTNRSYPIGRYLLALAPLEASEAPATNVPEAV